MRLAPPDLSAPLQPVEDIVALLRADRQLTELSIEDADAAGVQAKAVSIAESHLVRATFAQAVLEQLQIMDCRLENCDLTAAKLAASSWRRIEIRGSRCSGIQMQTSVLKDVYFKGCKLDLANLRFSKLENVIFEDCIVSELDMYSATLKDVSFINCDIDQVEFSDAKLTRVDISQSHIVSLNGVRSLAGLHISSEQLIQIAPILAANLGIIVKA